MIKYILFDVDGTLWDSAEVVTASWNEAIDREFRQYTSKVVTIDDMYANMGKTMTEIGLFLFPELGASLRDEIMQKSMNHENEYLMKHPGKFYPGLIEALEALRNACRFHIVSNCQDGYIQAMLQNRELARYIDDFECFGRTRLPKAESIRILMERNHIPVSEAVYVGDTAMDEAAADGAGIPFIHAAYGFGTAAHPAAVIQDISELPAAIADLNTRD